MLKEVMRELEIDEKHYPVNGMQHRISAAKNELMTAEEFVAKAVSPMDKKAGARLRALPGAAAARPTRWTSTTCCVNALPAARREPGGAARRTSERFRYISVDEYQDTNHAQYRITNLLAAGARQPHGRRRRRPVDLLVARRRPAKHPRVRARLPAGRGGQARAELPLDRAHPRGRQRGRRQQPQPQAQDAVHRQRRGREDRELPRERRARRGPLHRRRDREAAARRGPPLHRLRGLLPHQRAVAPARRRAAARRRAVPHRRRHALLRPRRDPRRDGATSRPS